MVFVVISMGAYLVAQMLPRVPSFSPSTLATFQGVLIPRAFAKGGNGQPLRYHPPIPPNQPCQNCHQI